MTGVGPEEFEAHRPRVRAVALRMLGSATEADDAVQETWLRASRADVGEVLDLGAWLTTVAARVCLNLLRSRGARREEPFGPDFPDPVVRPESGPEDEAVLADSVGLALLVVLETLTPAERLAFVLHDSFAVPFGEIGEMLGRSPEAARQLASRARRRVRQQTPAPEPDPARRRAVVDAFFAAAREGDFAALVAVLDEDVVLRFDGGPRGRRVIEGAAALAEEATTYGRLSPFVRPVRVDGGPGVVVVVGGRAVSVMGFTVSRDRIVAVAVVADPERLARLDLAAAGIGIGATGIGEVPTRDDHP